MALAPPRRARLPLYPETPFPDRANRRTEPRSDIDAVLSAHNAWIEERSRAGTPSPSSKDWAPRSGLPSHARASTASCIAMRCALTALARGTKGVRVIPGIVHEHGEVFSTGDCSRGSRIPYTAPGALSGPSSACSASGSVAPNW